MGRRRTFRRAVVGKRGGRLRRRGAAAPSDREAAPDSAPAPLGVLQLQRLVGNDAVQRLLVQRAPETGPTMQQIVTGLGEVGAAPPVPMFLAAIKAESPAAGLALYLDKGKRELIRSAYHDADARKILGALLRQPYEPGEFSVFYDVLRDTDPSAFSEVNDEIRRRFVAETGISGALDWADAADRPFARRWLMLRDEVMAERRTAEEDAADRAFKADLLAKAASPAGLHAALQSLDAETKHKLLRDSGFKGDLRDALEWDDFAGCVEDLGGRPPTAAELRSHSDVAAALDAAWGDSLPHAGALATSREEVATLNHEEGGWIYVNLVTNSVEIRRQDAAENLRFERDDAGNVMPTIDLEFPPAVSDCVLVGNFHTHPNESRYAGASGFDGRSITSKGVPGLLRDSEGVGSYGPKARASLRGPRGYPG